MNSAAGLSVFEHQFSNARSRNIAVSPKGGAACEARDKVEVAPCGFSAVSALVVLSARVHSAG